MKTNLVGHEVDDLLEKARARGIKSIHLQPSEIREVRAGSLGVRALLEEYLSGRGVPMPGGIGDTIEGRIINWKASVDRVMTKDAHTSNFTDQTLYRDVIDEAVKIIDHLNAH